ncbi:MAG: GTP pyrophosphokinase family protein [Clostridia bacterium]|nr:GTP pyrophosphokinase family protein [Clostridia bacterium]
MKDKGKNELLQMENFMIASDKINSSDETFNKLMFVYNAALKQLETKISILEDEFKFFYGCSVIDHTKTRIKKPESIIKKLENKGIDLTYRSLVENINDVAGMRIICPMKDDIFTIVDVLKGMPDVNIIMEKDYVTKPKKSGYASYHMIVEVPVQLMKQVIPVKAEIQIRTLAMDFWASLEHDLKYKTNNKISKKVSNELVKCAKIINKMDNQMITINQEIIGGVN